jgi:hypothetical protein
MAVVPSYDFSKALQTATGEERKRLLAGRYAKVMADDTLRARYGEDALSQEYLSSLRTANNPGSSASVAAPSLRGAQDLASLYGNVKYDMDEIRGIYDKRTADEYGVKRKEYGQTENQFYNNMYNSGLSAQDTLRRQSAQAITSGASKGLQAATALSAVLGLQQENSAGATKLAAARNLLVDEEQAALSKNVADALINSNDAKLKLGTLGGNLYAADTQFSAAQMAALAAEEQARMQLEGIGITANANRDVAGITGRYNVEAADTAGNWNYKSTGLSAEAQKAATERSSLATERAANAAANASRYAADQGLAASQAAGAGSFANPTLNLLLDEAVKSGNRAAVVGMLMQSGMTYEQANAEADKLFGIGAAATNDPSANAFTPRNEAEEEALRDLGVLGPVVTRITAPENNYMLGDIANVLNSTWVQPIKNAVRTDNTDEAQMLLQKSTRTAEDISKARKILIASGMPENVVEELLAQYPVTAPKK